MSSDEEYLDARAEEAGNASCDVTLGQFGLQKGSKFKYLFDFGDEWLFQCKVNKVLDEHSDKAKVIKIVGDAPEQYSYEPASFSVKYFDELDSFMTQITLPEKTLKSAFTSASAMGRLISAIENRVAMKIAISKDNLIRRTVNNMIAEKIAQQKEINLLTLYNTGRTTPITAAEAMRSPDFLRFAVFQILKYKKMMEDHQIEWEEGQHTEEKILNADEIIKSPGIPDTAPMIVKIKEKGIHIISEIEFAGRYTHSKMICITGSNGKTTTTSLIYHIFKKAGYDAGLAGNIGNSLALQVAEDPHEYYIIELCSFQLDNMYDFRANIAILLNITPDHLDRYDFKMQNYVDAKMRIIQNQTPQDAFIYWNDDPIIKKELEKYNIQAIQFPFSELKEKGSIGYIEEGKYQIEKPEPFNMEQESLSLTGKHNIYNSLAAGIATNIAGIQKDIIRQSLSDFPGVEHRLEKVCTVRGVQYINDSKATNVDACWYALESMKTKTILIIGGKDKGNDYEPIKPLIKEKCAGLVYLGADNQKLHDNFDALGIPVRDTHSMKDCVQACYEMAEPGMTVLLSPCCASFDLFKNMEDRGEQFKALAKAL